MKATGIKIIVEHESKEISTWHDVFETTAEEIINKVKHNKGWIGGKVLEAYIEFAGKTYNEYYKVYLDVNKFNILLA